MKTTAGGYRATQTEDSLTVHGVPIFVECQRGDINFDGAWVAAAVAKAKKRQAGGYMPPLHIQHHEPDTKPRPAGFFKITGAAPITFEGTRRMAIMADLIITDPCTQSDVLAMRLPYRSVEIFNVEKPGIDSLALLDHEAPFLELPMLMVSRVEEKQKDPAASGTAIPGATPGTMVRVADATFRMERRVNDGPMVACFRHGQGAALLFRDKTKNENMKTPEEIAAAEAAAAKATNFADDGPPEKKGGDDADEKQGAEEGGDGKLDVSAVVKAIEGKEISIGDMELIMAAIQSANAAPEAEEEEPQAPPAAGPEAMKNHDAATSAKFAAMQGTIDALEAKSVKAEADTKRKADVDAACDRLKDRPLGANLRAKLETYHAKFGADAFAAYVESFAETFGVVPTSDGGPVDFRAGSGGHTEAVMKYADKGADATEKAANFSRIWHDLKARGLCRQSEARYLEMNMGGASAFMRAE